MHKAYAHDARKVWIVNVGDLKPMEFQTEFFLRLAWDVDSFTPDKLTQYGREWAAYTFGESYGDDVAQVIRDYVKFNGRLKPEVINLVKLYSWTDEFEAERVLTEFEKTVDLAESLMERLPNNLRDAFYQVGYYPAKASYTVLKLQMMADLSKLHKKKGRVAANTAALEAKRLFEEDKHLTFEYNKRVSGGKWDHMMDQLHIGYTYWQQPDELVMPKVSVLTGDQMNDGEFDVSVRESDTTDAYTKKPLFVDIYNKGTSNIILTVACDKEWVSLDQSSIELSVEDRIQVDIVWNNVPEGRQSFELIISDEKGGQKESIILQADKPAELLSGGFIPVNGKIAIEAEHYSNKTEVDGHDWTIIPDYGRTLSSMAVYPVEFERDYSVSEAPRLSYDIVLPEETDFTITVVTAPSLPYNPDREMRLALSVDNLEPVVLHPGDLSQNGSKDSEDWEKSVIYNCHTYTHQFKKIESGNHSIHVTAVDPQVVIQKIIIDCGGVSRTYLGPQPTPHADKLSDYSFESPGELTDYSLIPGRLSKETIYVMTSGFYKLSAETNQVSLSEVDGQSAGSLDRVYLNQGFHQAKWTATDQPVMMTLEKEWLLSVKPVIGKNERGDWKIDLMLHYQGNASTKVTLDASLTGPSHQVTIGRTEGWLKADEQRLVNYVYEDKENKELKTLDILIESDGLIRTLSVPLVE
jgi:hypothetical protein